MLIKKKSLVVALLSSLVIALVIVITLLSYLVYLQIKSEESRHTYAELVKRMNAKTYASSIAVQKLSAVVEVSGPLKGKPIIEGVIKNVGTRKVSELITKVRFTDKEGATIYEVVLAPSEPSLGETFLSRVPIPRFPGAFKTVLEPGNSLTFKKILSNCPKEVLDSIAEKNKLTFEILSIDF